MLQIKNLTKVYKPKRGVPVTALDRVSLTLPQKGMVFLLGKSGSGKSTLLNLLGGLDSFDSGEIIISGEKTDAFRQKDFDSYRNTLVGFIFQEYNILEEFTVGANIALALELQGKKATDEEIEKILFRVDLSGYGARRPGELSGGQKQRVAIARALVKNPKIIMADEPTGALDSVTGRQVLDTLKKLSSEKLVIVVSHDREFAEKYADRIITLSDGRVICDEVYENAPSAFEEKGLSFGEGEIRISAGYHLTEEDREQINAYLSALSEERETVLSVKKRERQKKSTREEDIPVSNEKIDLIPSRLPLKPAFRIGAGALKHKKVRLAFTIFLSCIAFGLFGLSDTFGAYDHITTCVNSILDSNISYASVGREEKVWIDGREEKEYYMTDGGRLKEEEIEKISDQTGVMLEGVFVPYGKDLNFSHHYDENAEFTKSEFHIYPYSFNGFGIADENALENMDMPLVAGRMPQAGKGEIVITSYICETFMIGGFAAKGEDGKTVYEKISSPEDMLGKVLSLSGDSFTVVGIAKPGFDLDRYRSLTQKQLDESAADMILSYALNQELYGIREYSLAQVIFLHESDLKKMVEAQPPFHESHDGYFGVDWYGKNKDEWFGFPAEFFGTLENGKEYPILWVDGEKDSLAENEIVVSLECLMESLPISFSAEAYGENGVFDPAKLSEEDKNAILDAVKNLPELNIYSHSYHDYENTMKNLTDGKVVGILLPDPKGNLCDPGNVILANEDMIQHVIRIDDGIYEYAVGQMPEDSAELRRLVEFCYDESGEIAYPMQNSVCFELDSIHELLQIFSKVFFWVGVGFAVFAALMLSNFISTSIIYKKREIGILRAIGARQSDVFRIFFSESFVIAMINFLLSAAGTFVAVNLINYFVRTETGILITILSFSLRQIFLLFGVSVLVAFAASFLPVRKIASKKPIDAIRGR